MYYSLTAKVAEYGAKIAEYLCLNKTYRDERFFMKMNRGDY